MRGGVKIKNKVKIPAVTAVFIIALDQLTKAAITDNFLLNQVMEVIPGFFNIVYYKNPGAAFSVLNAGGFLRTLFLISVSAVALVIIGILIRRAKDLLMSFALFMIAGGAVGNLIDRVRFGYVVDFLDFYVAGYHWPAFNVADSAITAGVFLAVFSFYFGDKKD